MDYAREIADANKLAEPLYKPTRYEIECENREVNDKCLGDDGEEHGSLCTLCAGTGLGMWEGALCLLCKGEGII